MTLMLAPYPPSLLLVASLLSALLASEPGNVAATILVPRLESNTAARLSLPVSGVMMTGISTTEADSDDLRIVNLPLVYGAPARDSYAADSRAFELELLRLINAERANAGLPAFTEHPALTQSARRHAIDMARHDLNSHTGSDGSTPQQRMAEQGYDGVPWTEAIVLGRPNPSETLASWMQSPGHRDIVLDHTATEIGVGYGAGGSYGNAWVIDLGARR
jgi:uncharacterized protein YkwD